MFTVTSPHPQENSAYSAARVLVTKEEAQTNKVKLYSTTVELNIYLMPSFAVQFLQVQWSMRNPGLDVLRRCLMMNSGIQES